MPRNHARVQVSIWQDKDYCALSEGPQRLYLFLLSQGNVTHLGVLPITAQRWARATAGYSVSALWCDLEQLALAGFVVVDDATEEVLVRSLFRRDGAYKQPNIIRAAVVAAAGIYSPKIRRALLAELDRIDLSDVSIDKQGDIVELLVSLRDVLETNADEQPSDPDGSTRTEVPKEGVVEGVSEGVAEGVAVPFPHPPTRARACAIPPTPSPTPSPRAAPVTASEPPGFADWYATYPVHKARGAAAKAYAKARREVSPDVLLAGARRFADDPTRDPQFTPHPATWLNAGRWDDEGPARPASTTPNASEQRTQHNLSLVARFAEREQQQPQLGAS